MGKRLHSYNSAGSTGKYIDQRQNIPFSMKNEVKVVMRALWGLVII